jgi:hypothetical protein
MKTILRALTLLLVPVAAFTAPTRARMAFYNGSSDDPGA